MIIGMTEKKHYHSETIEFQNGHTTVAKPLTIGKLRLLQDLFEEFGEDTRKVQLLMAKLVDDTQKLAGKDEEQEALFKKAKADIKKMKPLSYTDTVVRGALIALNAWGVKDASMKPVDEIDLDYIENNLDLPTLERINEVAGNMNLGDVSEADVELGKAAEA